MKRAGAGALLLIAATAALAAAAQTSTTDPRPTRISWLSPPGDPARGEQLGAVCLTCHAADSPVTDPVAPRLHRQRASYMFFALAAYRDGERKSPIMGPLVQGMSDQDLRDVVAYLAGRLHNRPPPAQEQHPFYARAARDCTWCHGETGIGEFEAMPVLAGQDPAYFVAALEEYASGARSDPTMRGIVASLSPEDRAGLADYYSRHEWLERHK